MKSLKNILMKKGSFFLLLLCTTFYTHLQAQSMADEAAMATVAYDFMRAYNQQDATALQKLYTEFATRIDQEGEKLVGANQIAAFFAEQFKQNDATVFVRHSQISWSDREHAFVASGTYEVFGNLKSDGSAIHFTGRYYNSMIEDKGRWLIAKSVHLPLETEETGQTEMEGNIEYYEALWDRIVSGGQIDEINADNFDENIVMIASPENVVGVAAFKAYYSNFVTGFSEVRFKVVDAFGEGDKIVKHWTFKGRHTGDFFGIPATGRMVDLEGTTLAIMKDGKITQEQDFFDNMAFMQQLGILSDPGNVAVVEGLYNSFASGDIPGVLGVLDAQVVWNEAEGNALAVGNPYVGPDAVLNGVFAKIGAEHEYFNLKDIQLHEMVGNQVLATLRYDAKRKSNGALIDAQVAHLWTLQNGKVTAFQQYVDTKQLADAASK